MPRIRNTEEKARNEVKAIINYYMTLQLMDKKVLAVKAVIPYSTLNKRLNNPDTFTRAELRRLCGVLHISTEDRGKLI